jgi:methanogenic corrinoid protein MtbC1
MQGLTPLAQAVGDLEEEQVLALVDEQLASGAPAMTVMEELQAGMEVVGRRFEEGEYFLSELVFAGSIFKKASAPLQEGLKGDAGKKLGTIVLGTVKNDIHEFGKDIVASVLSSNGVEVVDLGVNVEPQEFVDAIKEHKPQLVGLSCLLTTAFDSMTETVSVIEAAGLRGDVTILIGGGPVDQASLSFVKADIYCETAQDGVTAAKRILEGH